MLNNIGLPGLLLIVIWVFMIYCMCRVMGKAGYHWAWGLVSIFGGAPILVLFLAFADWPSTRGT